MASLKRWKAAWSFSAFYKLCTIFQAALISCNFSLTVVMVCSERAFVLFHRINVQFATFSGESEGL